MTGATKILSGLLAERVPAEGFESGEILYGDAPQLGDAPLGPSERDRAGEHMICRDTEELLDRRLLACQDLSLIHI